MEKLAALLRAALLKDLLLIVSFCFIMAPKYVHVE